MDKRILETSNLLEKLYHRLNTKYYEVDDYILCIILSLISKTNMIALGQPGTAKSAIIRDLVACIDFSQVNSTPYFHIQMGSDISPNNVFGAPDIEYFKSHGIIKRHYKGFLPDAVIAFCSEFYRVNDQVANSGLLTILNEGEFKNGLDLVKTKLRFFVADTNFFPKQLHDLDAEETDLKLQALHDRFLARVLVKPLGSVDNKIQMILMDDKPITDIKILLNDIVYLQDNLHLIGLSEDIALLMIEIAQTLEEKHQVFISPRRLKMSRKLIKAHALFNGRDHCLVDDLIALQFAFWQDEEDLLVCKDLIYEKMNKPQNDAVFFLEVLRSIQEELDNNINNHADFYNSDTDKLYESAISDLVKLLERVTTAYPKLQRYEIIFDAFNKIDIAYQRLLREYDALKTN